MAAYIFAIFFATMVGSAIIMDILFSVFHQVPKANVNIRMMFETFSINYTFWLNVLAAILIGWVIYLNRKHPMNHGRQDAADRSDHR